MFVVCCCILIHSSHSHKKKEKIDKKVGWTFAFILQTSSSSYKCCIFYYLMTFTWASQVAAMACNNTTNRTTQIFPLIRHKHMMHPHTCLENSNLLLLWVAFFLCINVVVLFATSKIATHSPWMNAYKSVKNYTHLLTMHIYEFLFKNKIKL